MNALEELPTHDASAQAAPAPAPSSKLSPDDGATDWSSLENRAVDGLGVNLKEPNKPIEKPVPTRQDSLKKPAEPAKPVEKAAVKPAEKPAEKPADKGLEKETPAPAEKTEKRPWQLAREAQREVDNLKKLMAERDAELKALKENSNTPAHDPEKETLRQKIKEYEDEIKYVNYQKSPDFLNNYQKPYEDTVKKAIREATELFVTTAEGQERPLSKEEFWSVVSAPSLQHAKTALNRLFPNDALSQNIIMQKRSQIWEKHEAIENAKLDYQQNGAAREKERAERELAAKRQSEEQRSAMDKTRISKWNEAREAVKSHPSMKEFLTPDENDAKAKEMITKGSRLADMAFGARNENGEIIDETGAPVGLEKTAEIDAVIHGKAAAFNHLAYKYRSLAAKLADAEKKLAGYTATAPGAGEAQGGAKAASEDENNWEAQLERMAR